MSFFAYAHVGVFFLLPTLIVSFGGGGEECGCGDEVAGASVSWLCFSAGFMMDDEGDWL